MTSRFFRRRPKPSIPLANDDFSSDSDSSEAAESDSDLDVKPTQDLGTDLNKDSKVDSHLDPPSASHIDPNRRHHNTLPNHPIRTPTPSPSFSPYPSVYTTLRTLRRATLSISNRLNSIISDSTFITSVASHYNLPLIANERCGSWYIPPRLKYGSVYFKSTDGHHGQWSLSLRRLNLQLLRILGEDGGAVVVDSTRRGKLMPDALAKSVPIWVTVWNKLLFPERRYKKWWQVRVPESVGESERSQIQGRVEGWCEGLRGLGLDLKGLSEQCKRPIQVLWAVNGEWEEDDAVKSVAKEEVNLLVLCSASWRVVGAEISEGGYIQGAGDDSEGWSRGLTAQVFWKYKDLLLETPEEALPALIDQLLKEDHQETTISDPVAIQPTKNIFIGAGTRTSHEKFDLVINCNGDSGSASHRILDLRCPEGKLGSKDLREKMRLCQSFAATTLERNPACRILITCSTSRNLSVGVALVFLCLYFDDMGTLRSVPGPILLDKAFVKKRLAWITNSKPDANPSRSTLQAVNSFLMERPN